MSNRNKFNLAVLVCTVIAINFVMYSESIDLISHSMGGRILIAIVAVNLLNVAYGIRRGSG